MFFLVISVSHSNPYSPFLSVSIWAILELIMGVISSKGVGGIKKLFVDDVDGLEVLVVHSLPKGIANLMIPIAAYIAMFFIDYKCYNYPINKYGIKKLKEFFY